MTLSLSETKVLFALVLGLPTENARKKLYLELQAKGREETEFYRGVLEHHEFLDFGSEHWFDFLSKVPNRVFRDELAIMSKLSPSQRERLPPPLFESS